FDVLGTSERCLATCTLTLIRLARAAATPHVSATTAVSRWRRSMQVRSLIVGGTRCAALAAIAVFLPLRARAQAVDSAEFARRVAGCWVATVGAYSPAELANLRDGSLHPPGLIELTPAGDRTVKLVAGKGFAAGPFRIMHAAR